jgi:hypothetical protein
MLTSQFPNAYKSHNRTNIIPAQITAPNVTAAADETPRGERAHAVVAHVAKGRGRNAYLPFSGVAQKNALNALVD